MSVTKFVQKILGSDLGDSQDKCLLFMLKINNNGGGDQFLLLSEGLASLDSGPCSPVSWRLTNLETGLFSPVSWRPANLESGLLSQFSGRPVNLDSGLVSPFSRRLTNLEIGLFSPLSRRLANLESRLFSLNSDRLTRRDSRHFSPRSTLMPNLPTVFLLVNKKDLSVTCIESLRLTMNFCHGSLKCCTFFNSWDSLL